jgi:ribosome-binding factor A
VAEAIREVVASSILFEVSDPRVRNLTVLSAEVSPDLRYAKVFVSVTGDQREEKRVMHGLQSARGFLQSKIAARLQTRVTPELRFEIDNASKRTTELLKLIETAVGNDQAEKPADEDLADIDEDEADDDESDDESR